MELHTEFRYLAPDAERYATYDLSEYDGAPDAGPQLVGVGPTPEAARQDFWEQYVDRESERDVNRALKQMKVWDSFLDQIIGGRR
jgi:hypothetical protein